MELMKPTIEDILVFASDIASFVPTYAGSHGFMDIKSSELFKVLANAIVDHKGYVLLAVREGKAVGLFIGSVYSELFTGKKIGCQNAIYLKKGCGDSWQMVRLFEEHCEMAGCKSIHLHTKDMKNASRWERVYARRGYKPSELRFNKEL